MMAVVELDVRPHLRKKLEPFQIIMEAVKDLGPDDTFVLHATFKPTPLLGVLMTKGYANKAEQLEKDHWKVTFVPKARKHELENGAAAEGGSAADGEAVQEATPGAGAGAAAHAEADGAMRTIRLDNRGLEPPQPMMRTLSALEKCGKGDKVVIHNDRVPVFLIEELNALGYPFEVEEQPDGSAQVTIRKASIEA
jgi:uncharacterized protein (DUF2249 family)